MTNPTLKKATISAFAMAMTGLVATTGPLTTAGSAFAAEQRFVSIGTGGVTGVYYPAGGAICRLVNKNRKEHGIRCSVESTGGSVHNVNSVRAGEAEFGVAQSDVQANAYNGERQYDGEPFKKLRSVFSVYPEPMTMVVRADSKISSLGSMKGKRVNIGNPGSGQRATWDLMEAEGVVKTDDLGLATELRSAEVAKALCDQNIDAYLWMVGHPSGLVKETLATCDSHLVSVAGAEIDALVSKYPYFRKAAIPAGTYNNESDVETFGVGATFVTSTDVDEKAVYVVVKAVFENLDQFRKLHPAFANLKPQEMIKDSLTAPLHPGAVKYYKERGWM